MNAKQKGEKILLMALRKGKIKCSKACPFYTESGVVQQFGGKKKTHCRGTMQPVVVDCNEFNPCEIETVEVTEKQWSLAQLLAGFKARILRRLYPEEHEEIHPVGYRVRQQGRTD